MKKHNSGIGFVGLLTIILIVLKLLKLITCSWIWVLSPIWISTLIVGIPTVIILWVVELKMESGSGNNKT